MSDLESGAATATETTPTDEDAAEQTASEQAATETPPEADDLGILDKIDPEKLIKHPRVAGIIGDRTYRAQQAWKQAEEERQKKEAAEKAEAELLRLAEEDPLTFSRKFLDQKTGERWQRQLRSIEAQAKTGLVKQISAAITSLEEYRDLSPEDIQAVATALANKPDGEALGVYTKEMVGRIVSRSASKRVEAEVSKRLETEKKAWRKEWEAERLNGEPAPHMGRTGRRPVDNIMALPDEQFDAAYEERYLGRTRRK